MLKKSDSRREKKEHLSRTASVQPHICCRARRAVIIISFFFFFDEQIKSGTGYSQEERTRVQIVRLLLLT